MVKSNKKGKRVKYSKIGGLGDMSIGDITVNDFANNAVSVATPSKNKVSKSAKSLALKVQKLSLYDEKAWDEESEEEDSFSENSLFQHSCKHPSEQDSGENYGVEYPIDIWFLISEYIEPEYIGKFSSLCHSTRYVVSTARFWFTLYRRYHKWVPNIPDDLSHWNMDKTRGLKSSVIRCLFYMYPVFTRRISAETSINTDISRLIKAQCVLQWSYKTSNQYKYLFKFLLPEASVGRRWSKYGGHTLVCKSVMPDVVNGDSLVHFNLEEWSYILEVTTTDSCSIGMVIGDYLCQATAGLSPNFYQHKVRLSFAPEHLLSHFVRGTARGKRALEPKVVVLLEPAVEVRIYPWWHPQYARCHSFHGLDKDP